MSDFGVLVSGFVILVRPLKLQLKSKCLMDHHLPKLQCLGGMIGCNYSKLFCGVKDWVVGSLELTSSHEAACEGSGLFNPYSNQMLRGWLLKRFIFPLSSKHQDLEQRPSESDQPQVYIRFSVFPSPLALVLYLLMRN